MERRLRLLSLLLPCLGACTDKAPESFIANQSDFAAYASWERFELGVAMNNGKPVGPELGFRNQGPDDGTYEVGSILVKEVHVGDVPQQWEIFAMAKRGGIFNAYGARGWEFFTLRLDEAGVPIIISRGSNPTDGDFMVHGYGFSAGGVTCNRCHGASALASDHVLSSALAP